MAPLEDLWGDAATVRSAREARDTVDAAATLESAMVERLATADGRHARA
jgi:hypothetical protein